MQSQTQVKERVSHPVQPPFVLTDLFQMASAGSLSPQGVLLNPKSEQDVMQAFKEVLTSLQCILNFQHVRVLQGGLEVDMFVMSSLSASLFAPSQTTPMSQALPRAEMKDLAAPTASFLPQAELCRDMIDEEIGKIFQYRRFGKDCAMANSSLHRLTVVEQACQRLIRQRELSLGTLSKHDKARALRLFLTNCLDDDLCPALESTLPRDLSPLPPEIRTQWIAYLILRWQYVDGESRAQVERELAGLRVFISSNQYKEALKAGRERLSGIIWQKEMQARKLL